MNIKASWKQDIQLQNNKKNLIYWVDFDKISTRAGCYVFFNKHGKSYSIIYIGKAINLRTRIEQQFTNNVQLMMGIKNFIKGSKLLMYCEIEGKSEARLKMLETQLIKSAVLEGHKLLNIKGTKRVLKNEITFSGNRHSENMFGRKMYS